MKKKIQYIYICLLGALLLGAHSCADDPMINPDYTVSGKPTTVSFKLTLPAMTTVKNRAFLQENEKNLVEDVWVATYNASGERTGFKLDEGLSSTTSHPDASHPNENTATVTGFDTKSGYSYIVAVANVKENFGYQDVDHLDDKKALSELLSGADTWEKFRSIVVENNDLNTPGVPLVMSGCFLSETKDANVKWETQNYEKVFIPADGGADAMVGAIHLRRLVAHVTFNLVPGPNVSLEPQSYRIYNVPKHAYVYERDRTNSGGVVTEDTKGQHYMDSEMFDNRYFTANNADKKSWTFDFWQLENKHTGKESCTSYDLREKEHKDENKNSGIYTSLSGDTWTSDNMATYVEIRCRVNRGEVNVDDNGLSPNDDGGKSLYRYGDAVFTVHLGYCEGKDADNKATEATCRDFNCRRNVDYTYNVTVNDVSNIVVEANSEEQQPGMEGVVNDVENEHIDLDCHYATFNIQITNDELESTAPGTKFGFVIEAWDAQGKLLTFNEETNWDDVSAENKKYADWIELRATTAEDVLAEYKPLGYTFYSDGDKKTFLLRDFNKDLAPDCKSDNEGWYTVFVNEYVYETSTNGDEKTLGDGAPAWAGYVNKPDRRFWIRTVRKKSPDEESVYMRSKYAVSQKSIQTYYSTTNFTEAETVNKAAIPRATAIGAEHVNENRGLSLQKSTTNHNNDPRNGRFNVWNWLSSKSADKDWSDFVNLGSLQQIPAVNKQGIQIVEHNAYLPATKEITPATPWGGDYNPSEKYIEAINACMNRNRDNNGDGKIDASELRWYVPATGKYLRLILGRNSLKTPIMNYDGVEALTTTAEVVNNERNKHITNLMLYSSDERVVWAMEGLATSAWGDRTMGPPWEVRCIRNLGSDLSTVAVGEKVSAAYKHDSDKRRVTMTYYDDLSVRKELIDGYMPRHCIYDARPQYNYNRVYKAFEYSVGSEGKGYKYDYHGDGNGWSIKRWLEEVDMVCDNLNYNNKGRKWRVPNQKELAIMRNLGLFDELEENNALFLSCTQGYYDIDGVGLAKSLTDSPDNVFQNRGFLGSRRDGGSQLINGYNNLQLYVRCVRDVEPDE